MPILALIAERSGLSRLVVLAVTAALAIAASFTTVTVHDRKVASRVIEKSQREAHKDVAIGKDAQSASLSGSSGVRSGYRRD